jgi:hypothetical protein
MPCHWASPFPGGLIVVARHPCRPPRAHVVQLAKQFQGLLANGALVIRPQLVEFAPRGWQAAGLRHPVGEESLVSRIVITHQHAPPSALAGVAEKLRRMLSRTSLGKVECHQKQLQVGLVRGHLAIVHNVPGSDATVATCRVGASFGLTLRLRELLMAEPAMHSWRAPARMNVALRGQCLGFSSHDCSCSQNGVRETQPVCTSARSREVLGNVGSKHLC